MSLVLNVEILGEFKKLTAATKGAGQDLKGLNATTGKISKSINGALGAIGVGFSLALVIDQFKQSTKAAIDDRKSQELLANQLRNTTGATDTQIKSVEKAIGKMQLQAAVADDTLRPAFAQLTRATGDTAESTKLLDLALDISAGSGKSLETVTMALTKAYNGQFGALTKLGVPMTDQIANANDFNRIQKELNKALDEQALALSLYGPNSEEFAKASQKVAEKQDTLNQLTAEGVDWQGQLADAFEGSAEAAAKTDPYAQMEIIFGELQEQVGTALLPILEEFSTWLSTPEGQEKLEDIVEGVVGIITEFTKLVDWISDNEDTVVGLGTALLSIVTATKLLEIASRVNAPLISANYGKMFGWTAAVITALQLIDQLATRIKNEGGLDTLAPGSPGNTFIGSAPGTQPGFSNMGPSVTGFPTTTKPTTTKPTTTPPKGGIPVGNIVINNNTVVNTPSTNPSGIVSSLQGYQNQTGANIRNLLK